MGRVVCSTMGKLSIFFLTALICYFSAVQAEEDDALRVAENEGLSLFLNREAREAAKKNKSKGKKVNKKNGKKKQRKNNKRKSRKMKNKNKKQKKGRKSGKKNKGKKQRKDKKEQRKSKASRQNKQQSDECVLNLAELGGVYRNKDSNFFKQAKRALRFADLKSKKLNKKDEFEGPKNIALNAVGGNASAPICNGQSVSSNSSIVGSVQALEACKANIENACPVPAVSNLSAVEDCLNKSEKFRADFLSSIAQQSSASQVCSAVISLQSAKADVLACKDIVANAESAQKAEKIACFNAFQACRKEERNALSNINDCAVNVSVAVSSVAPSSISSINASSPVSIVSGASESSISAASGSPASVASGSSASPASGASDSSASAASGASDSSASSSIASIASGSSDSSSPGSSDSSSAGSSDSSSAGSSDSSSAGSSDSSSAGSSDS